MIPRIDDEDILFDTLEFLTIFPRRDDTELKVLLQCDEVGNDLIQITLKEVTFTRSRKGKSSNTTILSLPGSIKGWTKFELGLNNQLTLKDELNRSWAPPDVLLTCPIKKISIMGEHFTLHQPCG